MNLQIDGQHTDIPAHLRTMIEDRLAKLDAHHEDIIHARVSLVKNTHHQQGSDEARIVLSLTRRKVLQAAKIGKTIDEAVSSALDAMSRELSDYRDKRRGLDKPRLKTAKIGPRLSGKIVQVALDQGYGFVDLGDDEEVHFLRQAVAGGAFEELAEGMAVEVDVMETPAGYQATRVVLLHPGQRV